MNISYGRHKIEQDDIDAVVGVLKSEFLTFGPMVTEFEESFARYVGSKYAVSFCNATTALHVGFKVLNKNIDKKVIVTPNTFAASSNCVLYEGGKVEFVDIDPNTFNIDLDLVEALLAKNPNDYQGIIPVDFGGLPVDSERLKKIADRYNLWIMEDACHAIGGGFYNSDNEFIKCGSGKYSDLTVFSFHPVKHIATGEGGMITTNCEKTYRLLSKYRSQGIERDEKYFEQPAPGAWYHEMQVLGYNYRMSDISAALGVSQLKRIDLNIARRNEIAKEYKNLFMNTEIKFQVYDEKKYLNAYHLFVIQTDNRKELFNYLRTKEIYSQVHYIPVYKHPYYQRNGYSDVCLPNEEAYYSKALSLPMFHGLTAEEYKYVVSSLNEFKN